MFFAIFAIPKTSNVIRVQIQSNSVTGFETVTVPITPFTTSAEIVYCVQGTEEEEEEEKDQVYYLTHFWRGCERIISPQARPYVIVRECAGFEDENIFRLRHCYRISPVARILKKGETFERSSVKVQDLSKSLSPDRSPGPSLSHQRPASCMAITDTEKAGGSRSSIRRSRKPAHSSTDSSGLTVDELRQISARQQRHIECQRKRLSEKSTRMRQLRQKEALKKKSGELEDATVTKLRTSIEENEATIRQTVATRMQVNEFKFSNENMGMELDSLKTTFAEKQRELSRYAQRVEELKVALDQLRYNTTMSFSGWTTDLTDRTSPSKFPTPGFAHNVNTELKAKFGSITETDDAKELSQKLEDKRRETSRLDEQLALLRTRLGLQDAKPFAGSVRVPPPLPIRSLSPPRQLKPGIVRPPSVPAVPTSKSLDAFLGYQSDSSSSPMERSSGGRYAPRAVINDTYMRRLRPGRPLTAAALSTEKLSELKKGAVEAQSASYVVAMPDQSGKGLKANVANVSRSGDSNNNDSGLGPSTASSVPSGSGTDPMEDDVFASSLPVPPPAAFEGELTSPSGTKKAKELSSDVLSSTTSSDAPQLPDASSKPRKSCLKASCDIVMYTSARPNQLLLGSSQDKTLSLVSEALTPGGGLKQSVSFDPLALLLDASAEGELSLVKVTALQVRDVSAGNDEGTTALHNSVCSGHEEITRYLVEEVAADVNSVDIDGWTPLHCAASCSCLATCRLLVENGAALFLCTNGDDETALDKCDEEGDAGQRTAEYLFNVQEQLGVINDGVVYAVFPYQAKKQGRIIFRC